MCLFHGSHARKLPVAKLWQGCRCCPVSLLVPSGSAPLPAPLPLLFSTLFSLQPKGAAAAAGLVLPRTKPTEHHLPASALQHFPCMNVNGESHGSLPTSTATGQGAPQHYAHCRQRGAHCCPVFPGALVSPHPNPCFSFIADSQLGILTLGVYVDVYIFRYCVYFRYI